MLNPNAKEFKPIYETSLKIMREKTFPNIDIVDYYISPIDYNNKYAVSLIPEFLR